ncbi:hypothetical protein RKD39_002387 [Streptomyces albogriseolus]
MVVGEDVPPVVQHEPGAGAGPAAAADVQRDDAGQRLRGDPGDAVRVPVGRLHTGLRQLHGADAAAALQLHAHDTAGDAGHEGDDQGAADQRAPAATAPPLHVLLDGVGLLERGDRRGRPGVVPRPGVGRGGLLRDGSGGDRLRGAHGHTVRRRGRRMLHGRRGSPRPGLPVGRGAVGVGVVEGPGLGGGMRAVRGRGTGRAGGGCLGTRHGRGAAVAGGGWLRMRRGRGRSAVFGGLHARDVLRTRVGGARPADRGPGVRARGRRFRARTGRHGARGAAQAPRAGCRAGAGRSVRRGRGGRRVERAPELVVAVGPRPGGRRADRAGEFEVAVGSFGRPRRARLPLVHALPTAGPARIVGTVLRSARAVEPGSAPGRSGHGRATRNLIRFARPRAGARSAGGPRAVRGRGRR